MNTLCTHSTAALRFVLHSGSINFGLYYAISCSFCSASPFIYSTLMLYASTPNNSHPWLRLHRTYVIVLTAVGTKQASGKAGIQPTLLVICASETVKMRRKLPLQGGYSPYILISCAAQSPFYCSLMMKKADEPMRKVLTSPCTIWTQAHQALLPVYAPT